MIHEKADTVKDWETEKDQAQNSFIKSQHSSMRSRAATTKKILGNSDFDLKSTSLKTSDLKSEKGAKDALISPVNAGSKKIALPESNSDNNLRELEIDDLDFEPEPSNNDQISGNSVSVAKTTAKTSEQIEESKQGTESQLGLSTGTYLGKYNASESSSFIVRANDNMSASGESYMERVDVASSTGSYMVRVGDNVSDGQSYMVRVA